MTPPPGQGLTLRDLGHTYPGSPRPVLQDVSLEVAPGEIVCLLGPSGCGKTTTLRMAAGLETAQQGRIHLNGRLVSGDGVHIPPEARQVGFLFQDYALFPHLDVRANVEFGLDRLARPDRQKRALDMLDQVGMGNHARSWPHQLSGGQQQRVALARALAPAPSLMLLDEPFSSLDKRLRDQIRDETLGILKRSRVATLMVTHDPEEAMFMADRIAVMKDGRIVQVDHPERLYRHPATAFVASFFGEVNVLPATIAHGQASTAMGDFDAGSLPSGTTVEVLVRPEGISLAPDDQGAARVISSRSLGRMVLVTVAVDGLDFPIQARINGPACPPPDQRLTLRVDHDQAFVFALAS